jgi:hypothetical protein
MHCCVAGFHHEEVMPVRQVGHTVDEASHVVRRVMRHQAPAAAIDFAGLPMHEAQLSELAMLAPQINTHTNNMFSPKMGEKTA